jgi:hypothetical protein
MTRTVTVLLPSTRVTDHISLGVVTKFVPHARITSLLEELQKSSQRERDLPAPLMVYYVIALALYMGVACREVLRVVLEGFTWLQDVTGDPLIKIAGPSGISQARTRLGWEVFQRLHDQLVTPVATAHTPGAWYRGWKLVSLDGSTMAVADTVTNATAFGRPGASRGKSAFPQIRFVSLVENGTHVLFATQLGAYTTGEGTLATPILSQLQAGMLCLADRNFFSYERWNTARATGADLLWRVKKNLRLPVKTRLPDGSYLSTIYPTEQARRHHTGGVVVRVIEYRLEGVPEAEPLYRVITTILDASQAPAQELAALYHERWEIENALDELKTHLRGGAQIVLRSKTPDLVRQEFWGLMLAHYAVRALMHEAALKVGKDPDHLSFLHAVRVIRRKLPWMVVTPPSEGESDV